jgi:hypothetical protein
LKFNKILELFTLLNYVIQADVAWRTLNEKLQKQFEISEMLAVQSVHQNALLLVRYGLLIFLFE